MLIWLLLLGTGNHAAIAQQLAGSSGAQLFRQYCASCHGRSGHGDGPVAPFFKLSPPDLTQISRRSGGTFPTERVRRTIDGRENPAPHGAREMPVWGLQFEMTDDPPARSRAEAEAAIQRLVEYLRALQRQ
jgi:mono/diheme cytochrome c family protein